MIEHTSEMELYMILPTLEKFFILESDSFNHKILVGKMTYPLESVVL